jgi:hypothetical protein
LRRGVPWRGSLRLLGRGGSLGFLLTETLLGFGLGPASGLLFETAAIVFLALAGLGGLALGLLGLFLFRANAGGFLSLPALLRLADLGLRQCGSPRGEFCARQLAQHDAARGLART